MSIERDPKPGRTKRGAGVGAKLDLSIYYYRASDGVGPDYGTFSGRDDDGRWEGHFASPTELESQLTRIVAALLDEASQARQESLDNARPEVWLKAIGAAGWPADEIWWDERSHDQGVNFPYRPRSINPGDLLVVYAAGTGNVVGVLKTKGPWYYEGREERWPYRIDTEIIVARPISDGIALDSISDEREIGKSIRQKSHVRLSNAEASTALSALGVAA